MTTETWAGAESVLADFKAEAAKILAEPDETVAAAKRAWLHEHALEIIATHGTGPIGGLARIALSTDPLYLSSIARRTHESNLP